MTSQVADPLLARVRKLLAKAEDAGDLGYAWKRSAHGSYKLRLDVGVKAQDIPKETGRAAK